MGKQHNRRIFAGFYKRYDGKFIYVVAVVPDVDTGEQVVIFHEGIDAWRTPVRKQFHGMFSGRRRLFRAALPPCSPPGGQAATPAGQVRVIMHGTVNSFRAHVHCETTPSLSRSPLKSDGCQQLGSDS